MFVVQRMRTSKKYGENKRERKEEKKKRSKEKKERNEKANRIMFKDCIRKKNDTNLRLHKCS